MAKFVVLGDHQVLIRKFRDAQVGGHATPQPFEDAQSLQIFRDTITKARHLLPARYQKPYVDVLEAAVNQAEASLKTHGSKSAAKRVTILQQLEMVFSALAAPIVQLDSTTHQKELKAFFSLISDIYRRFVDNRKVSKAAKTKLMFPLLDPLAAFGDDESGNFTLAPTAELPVAIISKPAAQTQFLPLWLADGHEVGGHSVQTSVQDFQAEMTRAVEKALRDAFKSGRIKASPDVKFGGPAGPVFAGKKSATMEDFMVELWRKWLVETSADAAGLLNMGPLFIDGLILLLASDRPTQQLSSVSVMDGRGGFVEHPIDVVRPLLALEMLKRLKFTDSSGYVDALTRRLKDVQGGALPANFGWLNRNGRRVAEVSRADMEAVLPVVAEALLESKLAALSDQSLTDIMTWTNADEQAVRNTCGRLLKGRKSVGDNIAARHVVSASMLAVEKLTSHQGFDANAQKIHDNALSILAGMYDAHCLLCNVQNLNSQDVDSGEVKLTDLVRLVRSMRGR